MHRQTDTAMIAAKTHLLNLSSGLDTEEIIKTFTVLVYVAEQIDSHNKINFKVFLLD